MPKRKGYDYPFGAIAKESDDERRAAYRRGFRAGLRKAISVIDEGQLAEEWAEDFDAETALREFLLATPAPKRKSR